MYSTEYSVGRNPMGPVIARKIALRQSTLTTKPAPMAGNDSSVTSGSGPAENVRTTTAQSATPAAPTKPTLAHPLAFLLPPSTRLTSAPASSSAALKPSRETVLKSSPSDQLHQRHRHRRDHEAPDHQGHQRYAHRPRRGAVGGGP